MELGNLLAIVAISLTVVGFLVGWFGFVGRILQRLSKLEVKVDLFWGMVEENISTILHSPNHPTKDDLLDKLKDKTLIATEAMELKEILRIEYSEAADKTERLAYLLVLTRLEIIIIETNGRR